MVDGDVLRDVFADVHVFVRIKIVLFSVEKKYNQGPGTFFLEFTTLVLIVPIFVVSCPIFLDKLNLKNEY